MVRKISKLFMIIVPLVAGLILNDPWLDLWPWG